jgi:hypothetical protein
MLNEFIRNPLYVILAVVIIWQLLNLILIRCSNLSRKFWARLEYIWIAIGFMAVISIVIRNDLDAKRGELAFSERWIENQFEYLLKFADRETNCFQFQRSKWLEKEEFDRRQAQSDRICNWVKEEILPALQKSKKEGYSKIIGFNKFKVENYENYTLERINEDIIRINKDIESRDSLEKTIEGNLWEGIQSSLGVLLLVFVFGLRLTLVTKKVIIDNKQN